MSSIASLPSPSPAIVHNSARSDEPSMDSVGYTFFSTSTRASRHDRPLSAELPPSYMESEAVPPPQYSIKDEPLTLAMYLFKFGFLFPPFWIMGVFILCSPLRTPPGSEVAGEWLPDKTDAEKQIVIDRIRRAELKWARRCLYALIAFALVAVTVGLTAWAISRHH